MMQQENKRKDDEIESLKHTISNLVEKHNASMDMLGTERHNTEQDLLYEYKILYEEVSGLPRENFNLQPHWHGY